MILHTLFNFFLPVIILFAGGLTVLLWLLPREYLTYGFFFAPVVGLTVFASLGLFEIGVLLVPLRPLAISFFIGLTFVATAWLRRERLITVLTGAKAHCIFIIIPLALLLILAVGTRDYGLSFLSAGQDEIQYVNNSLQILQHQHTGDELDTLLPRVDHWARDAITIELSYSQTYRRGAEIFLAGVMGITGENPFVSFTVAGVIAFCCFILALPAICRAFLSMSTFYSILVQAILATSHLWIMLVFQGSLANLCSLSLFCLAATAVPQLNSSRQLKGSVLAGLLLAGPIIFYNEVAMAVLLAPLGLLLIIGCIKNRAYLKTSLHNVPVTISALILFSHIALFGLAVMTHGLANKSVAIANFVTASFSLSSAAGVLSPIYGIYTYYSMSFTNNWLAQLTSATPWAVIGPITLIHVIAAWGLFSKKMPGAYVLGAALMVLDIVTLHSLRFSEPFMLVRSQQYAFSYIAIGLVLALSLIKNWPLKVPVIAITLCLMGINISTIWSTAQHLSKYDDRSDPTIIRYSPHSELWTQFLKHANRQGSTPVLITGYDSTAKPLLIASLIEPRANYMGAYIRNFWNIMPLSAPPKKEDYKSLSYNYEVYGSRAYGAHNIIFNTVPYWLMPDTSKGVEEMNKKSQIAIIMVGSNDPEEWQEKRLISRQRKRFLPIGDIIERSQWSSMQLEIDGLSVPAEHNEMKHISERLNIQLQEESTETVREVELIFDSVIKEEDIAPDQNLKDKIQISFKGKILTGRIIGKNVQSFPIKFSRKGGLNLKQLRLVEVY